MSSPLSDMEIKTLVGTLRAALPKGQEAFPLHEPEFRGREWEYVKSCLDDGWVSSVGAFVDRFEQDLADKCGVKHAIATVNGTAALHAALMAIGVVANDEVFVPALTFVATANAVAHAGAVAHFVDCDTQRLGVDVPKLAEYLEEIAIRDGEGPHGPIYRNRNTGRVLRAVMPMHVFGVPMDIQPLVDLATQYGMVIVEDAAEALGSTYRRQPVGSFGAASALSFNGNKIITTGGGGAVLTNSEELAKRVRHLCTTAKRAHPWLYEHDCIGYNYRMPNINAALGCAQLEQLDTRIKLKKKLAGVYEKALEGFPGVQVLRAPDDSSSNHWLNAIVLRPGTSSEQRDQVLLALNEAGLSCRPVWNLMHTLPMFADNPRMDLSCAEGMAMRIINMPSSSYLAEVAHDA
ncbi:LegC family aminotransferase [Thalassospira australica]|uniref:LegC family aminotransferase n=1 Tax=Thalassospira australica TaxID=1528106 RepID=UPI000B0FEE62|nr:LegC family aminotransferase [Thalassospira australica]